MIRRLQSTVSIAAAVLAVCAISSAQDPGPTRPLGVPTDYVVTPFGYFHPSCARHVAEGETVLADGRIRHADGTEETVAPVCDYPRYSASGSLISWDSTRAGTEPLTNGWVENISATTTGRYGKISATWTTPPQPTGHNGQTLFFFPGFEDIDDTVSILQPVLQWGPSAAGGGNNWAAASWNCCPGGTTDYSSLISVSAGDSMLGVISPTCSSGSCSTWNVKTEDKTTGHTTTLSKTPNEGQKWNWAFGAVMEVYGVTKCSDYPNNKGLTFTVSLYNNSLALISSPPWTKAPASGITPSCGFGLSSTATKERVEYNP